MKKKIINSLLLITILLIISYSVNTFALLEKLDQGPVHLIQQLGVLLEAKVKVEIQLI